MNHDSWLEGHIINEKKLQIQFLMDSSMYPSLVNKMNHAEKNNKSHFAYFSDKEIHYYYVHRQRNVDTNKNKAAGTKKEYLRELWDFATNLVTYTAEIGVEIEDVKEGSLFKSLSPRHVKRYQEWLVEKAPVIKGIKNGKYSAATIARKTSIIKSFLHFLYENNYTQVDLTKRLKAATVSRDEKPNKDLGPAEAVELLTFFKKEQHPILFGIIHVLITTGIRNSELCSARVCDLSHDKVRKEYFLRIHGKGNKKRLVPIKDKVFESIVEFRKVRGLLTVLDKKDISPLFTNAEGNPYRNTYLSRYINKAVQCTGLECVQGLKNPVTPHTFRHAFAIISFHSGADVYKIMRSLGHDKLQTTQVYLQKEFEKSDNAVHMWDQTIVKEFI